MTFEEFEEIGHLTAEAFKESSRLFDKILDECGVDKDENPVRWKLVRDILRRQTSHRIISTIWSAIEEDQVEHFNSFVDSAFAIDPEIDYDTILLNFAILYPKIRQKIFDSLQEFFDNFVENFANIYDEKT